MASKHLKTVIFPFLTMALSTTFIVVFVYGVSFFTDDLVEGKRHAGVSNQELTKSPKDDKSLEESEDWKETTKTVSFQHNGREVTVFSKDLPEEWTVISAVEMSDLYHSDSLIKLIQELNGVTFDPNQKTSLLDLLDDKDFFVEDELMVSIIATALYQLVLETNFEIKERHISDVLPVYSRLGLEAYVDKEHDLTFINPNKSPYVLSLTLEDNSLFALLLGVSFEDGYRVNITEKKTLHPELMIEKSTKVAEVLTKQVGHNGYQVTVYREKYNFKDPQEIYEKQLISEDYYHPVPTIEIHPLHKSPNTDINGEGFKGIKGY